MGNEDTKTNCWFVWHASKLTTHYKRAKTPENVHNCFDEPDGADIHHCMTCYPRTFSRYVFQRDENLLLLTKFSQNCLSAPISQPCRKFAVNAYRSKRPNLYHFQLEIMDSFRWIGSPRRIIRLSEVVNVPTHNLALFLLVLPGLLMCLRKVARFFADLSFVCWEICFRWLIISGFYHTFNNHETFISRLLFKRVRPVLSDAWSP